MIKNVLIVRAGAETQTFIGDTLRDRAAGNWRVKEEQDITEVMVLGTGEQSGRILGVYSVDSVRRVEDGRKVHFELSETYLTYRLRDRVAPAEYKKIRSSLAISGETAFKIITESTAWGKF